MKTAILILSLVVALLLFLLWDTKTSSSVTLRDLEATKKYHVEQADSLRSYVEKTKDSLNIAFATIRSLNEQREAAHQETQKWVKRYNFEKSQRIGIKTESEYDSILAELYPIARP